ncbi:MAG: TIGR00282 family metallophosphoesterase [Holosporales bacterium]|jgi:metallophosphoesterase (TIGR00282 family)|nr:TIGR00282 family metallophosphoesterase [Holosporales bacterium]
MRVLFCGDIVARSGREVIKKYIPFLKRKWKLDCVIVNGENAQHGYGLSKGSCELFYQSGVDVITMGNHVWDQKEMLSYIETDRRVVRPINFFDTVPGKGFFIYQTPKGGILVINAMGQAFIKPLLDNPFIIISNFLKQYLLGNNNIKAIIIDFHAEATSEKIGLGFYLDGRVSMVVGTHTHVPTADARILPKGTGFLSDAGMCGDYNSIIGDSLQSMSSRFLERTPMLRRPDPAIGEGTLCGVYLETNDNTGLANIVEPVCIGGTSLKTQIPEGFQKDLEEIRTLK